MLLLKNPCFSSTELKFLTNYSYNFYQFYGYNFNLKVGLSSSEKNILI